MAAVEVLSFRFTHRGKPAGTQILKTARIGRYTQLENHARFQGALGTQTVVQRSRCRSRGASAAFLEESVDRGGNRRFEVTFDAREGLVTASRGPRDTAQLPLLLPYRDPLSLLFELRGLGELEGPHRVPMLGKEVTVQYRGDLELETVFGARRARVYVLHPGWSVVYVAADPPHEILKLTQRLGDGHLDAQLVKIGTEAALEPFGVRGGRRGRGQQSARRRGRRKSRRRARDSN